MLLFTHAILPNFQVGNDRTKEGAVNYYDAQSKKWSPIGHKTKYAVGISFAQNGDILYITDHADKDLNEIRRLKCDDGKKLNAGMSCSKYTEVANAVSKIGDKYSWSNLVVTGDNTMLYAENTGHWIGYFKEGMTNPIQLPHNKNGKSMNHPWGVAISRTDGAVYISDYGAYKIWVLRP